MALFPACIGLNPCMQEVTAMAELMTVIGNYGFPMGVTAFLLVRIESKLGQLNESIQLLTKAIDRK